MKQSSSVYTSLHVFFPYVALDDLSKLPAIQQIFIEVNSFLGTLPPSIGNATTLVYMSLGLSNGLGPSQNLGQIGGFGAKFQRSLANLIGEP